MSINKLKWNNFHLTSEQESGKDIIQASAVQFWQLYRGILDKFFDEIPRYYLGITH